VGGGSIGGRHLRNLAGAGIGPLALVEPDTSRREALCAETGAAAFAELEGGLAWSPDLVVVASPTHLHVRQALEAVRRVCHVFIEKPLSHSLDGLDELSAEIEKRGLVSMVGCNMRFHPGPARIKSLLDEQAIGRVVSARIHTGSYLPEWRPGTDYRCSYSASEAMGGGAILDCIHEIDLALWYFGPGRLLAAASTPAETIGLEVEGTAELLIQHASRVISSVHLNFVQRDYRRSCIVVGSEGTIEWDWQAGAVQRLAPGQEPCRWPLPSDWVANDMYVAQLRHFLECVAERRVTANPVGRGIDAVNLALEAKRAAGANN
jgi:predicted dehydrogenase